MISINFIDIILIAIGRLNVLRSLKFGETRYCLEIEEASSEICKIGFTDISSADGSFKRNYTSLRYSHE